MVERAEAEACRRTVGPDLPVRLDMDRLGIERYFRRVAGGEGGASACVEPISSGPRLSC